MPILINELRRSNTFIWLLVIDILLFITMYTVHDIVNDIRSELISEIEYEVVGTAEKIKLTIVNEYGEEEYFSEISLPYNKIFKTVHDIYISAENLDSIGLVNVRIYKDGKIFKEDASDEGYATITVMSD